MPLLEEPSSCSMPKKARALLEKLSASERESEEYGLKEDSCIAETDPLTRKF
jgi:hypothetical protein